MTDALDINAELEWIIRELDRHDILQVNPDRVWPQSLYFGRQFRNVIQIRVSTHEKPYLPSKAEIDIVVKPFMTHEEIVLAVATAIRKFSEIEEAVSEEMFPSDGSGF